MRGTSSYQVLVSNPACIDVVMSSPHSALVRREGQTLIGRVRMRMPQAIRVCVFADAANIRI